MNNDKTKNPEMEEELDNIIILNDEDGKEVQFEFLDLIEYDEEEFDESLSLMEVTMKKLSEDFEEDELIER